MSKLTRPPATAGGAGDQSGGLLAQKPCRRTPKSARGRQRQLPRRPDGCGLHSASVRGVAAAVEDGLHRIWESKRVGIF